jgi:C-terminal processing protease CtpA/Prc
VRLVAGETTLASANAALVGKASVLDDGVGYVRVGRVADGLAKEVSAASQQLGSTNKLKGLVLDLRFADGDDYAAAAAAADLFTAKEQPLLDWGSGVVKSKAKTDALSLPLAVLVNRETGGAAEALAAVLRQTGAALLLGGATAGRAMLAQEFLLKSGQRLRIATTPVKLGDDTALSADGVKPDIEVAVDLDEERAYFKDAYAVLSGTNLLAGPGLLSASPTNRAEPAVRQPRLNEAELVREKREGIAGSAAPALSREAEQEKPVIRDPALARGVDLLKGLALVRRSRS